MCQSFIYGCDTTVKIEKKIPVSELIFNAILLYFKNKFIGL